jgi:hypothetical protein
MWRDENLGHIFADHLGELENITGVAPFLFVRVFDYVTGAISNGLGV